ncbi:MAG: insulinase family protein [Desulfobacterales bacterium]|nr:insulinase family protein [Desulfobacterales bacterium]
MRLCKGVFTGFLLVAIFAVVQGLCPAAGLSSDITLDVKEFKLDNGLLFLVVERPTTPQVACRVAIRAGSALEQAGKTGIAHMLEHMMFKGTKNFGTLDYKKDQDLQKRIEAAYQVVLSEESRRNPDTDLVKSKLAEMDRLRLEVQKIYIPQAFSSQLQKNGAVGVNAFTGKDQTQYTMSIPSDMLEQWFSMVSEQLFEPSWREFYVEKEVIQREWAFRYVNSPGGAAWLDLGAMAYTAHPYKNPTIGWKSDMERYSTGDAVKFHTKYYNPANAVCVLVGDVTMENVKRLARIYFERYPAAEQAPEEVTREPRQEGPRRSVRFLKGARTPLIRIGFHAARMGDEDFHALDVMTMILSRGRGARMTQNVINKGLTVRAWAHNPDNRYAGMVVVGGSPKEADETHKGNITEDEKRLLYIKACEGAEEILIGELEKLQSELVSKRELDRIKKLNQRGSLDRLRSNGALAGTLAALEVQVGWSYLETYLEKITQVMPEDVMRVAKKYIRADNRTSVYVIPGEEPDGPLESYTEVRSGDGSVAPAKGHIDTRTNNSIYPTPDGWKHPLSFQRRPEKIEYTDAEMEQVHGATLFYLPDKELPLIDLTILVKAGAVDVDENKTGLARLLSACLIRGGTEKLSPAELAMVLDENAIRLSVSLQLEETVIRLSVMKDDWEKGLAMLEEVIRRPGFDPEVLTAVKEQAMISLGRQGGNAHAVSNREAIMWHFKGHPYGRDPLLGLKTIPKITKDDLKEFLNKYFVASNMVVAVSGDIDKSKAVKGLEKLFQALPGTKAPERNLPDPTDTPPVLALIHKAGQVQSQVTLLLPGIKRTHPDYWKISLLVDILGGSDSLMYRRLRDDMGLMYAGGFHQTYRWNAGILNGYIGCKGDDTRQAIHEIINILGILREDIPKKDFEQKRLDVLNSFVFNVDTPAELVEVYGRYYMRKEPLDTLERIQESYINANREELVLLAGKFLDPKKIRIFVVADKGTRITKKDGSESTLEKDMMSLAKELDLSYREIELR